MRARRVGRLVLQLVHLQLEGVVGGAGRGGVCLLYHDGQADESDNRDSLNGQDDAPAPALRLVPNFLESGGSRDGTCQCQADYAD